MRINRFVAAASGLSRRAADQAISDGRIQVDGRPALTGETVAETNRITLDGQPLQLSTKHTYLALHKPAGYVSSRSRQGSDPTIFQLLPPNYQTLRPVGRLDRDSSGLILLSDDGDFVHQLAHPSFNKTKVYQLTLARPLTAEHRRQLEAGVMLADGPSRLTVLAAQGRQLTAALTEGRNRQLRRTLGALGYTVQKLHRQAVGPYQLGDLPSGQWRVIEPLTVSSSAPSRQVAARQVAA